MSNPPYKIKWVKKASQFCKTYFVVDAKGGKRQIQEWYDTIDAAEKAEMKT